MNMVSVAAGIVAFLFLAVSLAGWHFSRVVSNPKIKPVDDSLAAEAERGYIDLPWYESLAKTPFELESSFGYRISGLWIPAPESSPRRRAIVFAHGYGFNLAGSVKYIGHFIERGFDVVLYDHRHSGGSGGRHTTMGYFERHDLSLVLRETRRRLGPDALVGTHGESMGGATVLLQSVLSDKPDFIIADCPYSDLTAQLAYRLRVEYRLPAFPVIPLASLATKLRVGYFWGEVSPIRELRSAGGLPDLPVLFMHGEADDYILPSMSAELHAAKKGLKGLHLTPGAAHAKGVVTDRQSYMRAVDAFLHRVDPSIV